MALINCTTKGCGQKTEAKLDVATNKVICDDCGNEIPGISVYTKKILKDVGQIVRNKTTATFQSFCKTCNKNQSLYVDDHDRAFCKSCNTQVMVTPAFISGLKIYLKNKKD